MRIPKKSIREKSNNSSVSRGVNLKNSAVIYKVSHDFKFDPSVFAPSVKQDEWEIPASVPSWLSQSDDWAEAFFNISDHQKSHC